MSVACELTFTQQADTKYTCPAADCGVAAAIRADCEQACIGEWRCTGYDWNANAAAGQKCFMTGPWFTTTMVTGTAAQGFTHNDLARTCPGNRLSPIHNIH